MSELVCLECGKEMDYDWAPCPHCGWKPPEPWEMTEEEDETLPHRKPVLSKPNHWIQVTAWVLLAAALISIVLFFHW